MVVYKAITCQASARREGNYSALSAVSVVGGLQRGVASVGGVNGMSAPTKRAPDCVMKMALAPIRRNRRR